MKNTINFKDIDDIYETISDFILNLKSENKLSLSIPNNLENLEFPEKEEFLNFLKEKLEYFKNVSILKQEESKSSDASFSKTTVSTGENKKEQMEKVNENETNEKVNAKSENSSTKLETNSNTKTEKEAINGLNKPRKNYLSWVLGAGLTGLIGFGLFYMFSRKKH